MIVIAGKVGIRPGVVNEALEICRVMEEATRHEPGCITYKFYPDPREDAIFVFEEWETLEALHAHFKTPHMAEFESHLPNYVTGPMKIRRYHVDQVFDGV
jgi:quinol monooxygenase YgiN